MESPQTQPTVEASQLSPQFSKPGETYRVDYTWHDFKGRVYDDSTPGEEPIYIADFARLKPPHGIYYRTGSATPIGTGTLHFFNIDAEYEIHGRKDKIVAQKRFSTIYTFRSLAMSDTDQPVTMTWTSRSGFKTWDWVCVDENQMPVARLLANTWTKAGKIEFTGHKADSQALREELIVTGLTLIYHMMVRMNNVLGVVGALFSSPGHDKKDNSGRMATAE